MILVVGGLAQGQEEYARQAWPERMLIKDLQDLLRKVSDGEAFAAELFARQPEAVVLCNEIGCGVAPLTAEERRWREQTGRCLIWLAGRAEEVHRVCCGLGLRLK